MGCATQQAMPQPQTTSNESMQRGGQAEVMKPLTSRRADAVHGGASDDVAFLSVYAAAISRYLEW